MNKNTWLLIFFLTVLTMLTGFNYVYKPFLKTAEEIIQPQLTEQTEESTDNVQDQFNTFSSKEKINLLLSVPVTIDESTQSAEASKEIIDQLKNQKYGAFTIFGEKISRIRIEEVLSKLKTDDYQPLILVDHEGGSVQRFSGEGFTKLLSWQELCALDQDQMNIILTKSAEELASVEVDIILAPVVDVSSGSAVLKDRLCSGDGQMVTLRASQMVDIYQQHGILPVLKHFPGIGQTKRDLHKSFEAISTNPEELMVYKNILDKYPSIGVMISHAGVTDQYQNLPCSLSPDCVGELTSNYPQVLVLSDALEMKSALYNDGQKEKSLPEVAKEAILAGNNLLIFGPSVELEELQIISDELAKLYEEDSTLRAKVDISLNKISRLK